METIGIVAIAGTQSYIGLMRRNRREFIYAHHNSFMPTMRRRRRSWKKIRIIKRFLITIRGICQQAQSDL